MLNKLLTVNLPYIFFCFVCLLCITATGFLIQIVPLNPLLPSFITQLSCQSQQQTFSRSLDINVRNYHDATILHGELCSSEDITHGFTDITITWKTLPQLKVANNIYPYDAILINSPYRRAILFRLFPNYIFNAVSAPVPLALYHAGEVPAVTTETLWSSKVGVLASEWSVEHSFLPLALSRWGVMPEHLDIVVADSQQALEKRLSHGDIDFMLAPSDIAIQANVKATELNINAPTRLLLIHKKHAESSYACLLTKQVVMPLGYQEMMEITGCDV